MDTLPIKKSKKKANKAGNFDRYIKIVLGQVHPDVRISENAKSQVNYFLNLLALKLIEEAKLLTTGNIYLGKSNKSAQRKTISAREIQTAVRNILPTNLARYAISEGTKAVTKKFSADGGSGNVSKMSRKAGLSFPVARVENIIRANYKGNIGSSTATYLAAVLEYITAEMLELSGNAALDNKEKTLNSRYLMMGIKHDEELTKLAHTVDWDIVGGGVLPHIDAQVLSSIPALKKLHASKSKKVSKKKTRSRRRTKSRRKGSKRRTQSRRKGSKRRTKSRSNNSKRRTKSRSKISKRRSVSKRQRKSKN